MKGNAKEKYARVALFAAALGIMASAYAEEDTTAFVIAPPPVGYPEFVAGEAVDQTGLNGVYIALDSDTLAGDEDLTLIGGTVYANRQTSLSDRFGYGLNGACSVLKGSDYDLLSLNIPLALNAAFAAYQAPELTVFVFGGASGALGLTAMSFDIAQPLPGPPYLVTDTVTMLITTMTGSFTGGVQGNINYSRFVLSPFVQLTWTGGRGRVETESSMSYSYPSSESDLEVSQSTVFGFDILDRPTNVALSSMLRKDRDYTLITVSLKCITKRTMNGVPVP